MRNLQLVIRSVIFRTYKGKKNLFFAFWIDIWNVLCLSILLKFKPFFVKLLIYCSFVNVFSKYKKIMCLIYFKLYINEIYIVLTRLTYICFAFCIRDGVASRTYFASRMIIDFLCQMPELPFVFIGLPKLARMESRAAERVVVRAESVEHRRLIGSYLLYLRSCTFISVQPPFPDLRVVAQSMTIGKWYRESREFHSILDDLQALPLFRKVRWVKRMNGMEGADIVVTDTIRCSQWLQGMAGTHRCICDEAEG